ncbi:hypothetical protein [Pyxidicoccus trucidator]|uniref:hypothetical protein n=1 Tax=Pyxidicoccus trucidator TaxID=2709662 RepID=UPI0013D93C49|nr:hypothetical protein [Pyxidicoccus trucidator]
MSVTLEVRVGMWARPVLHASRIQCQSLACSEAVLVRAVSVERARRGLSLEPLLAVARRQGR